MIYILEEAELALEREREGERGQGERKREKENRRKRGKREKGSPIGRTRCQWPLPLGSPAVWCRGSGALFWALEKRLAVLLLHHSAARPNGRQRRRRISATHTLCPERDNNSAGSCQLFLARLQSLVGRFGLFSCLDIVRRYPKKVWRFLLVRPLARLLTGWLVG